MKYTYKQNGGYDSNILCGDCDNHILGEFDKEGYRVLFNDFNKYQYVQIYPQYKIYQIDSNNFDYKKLRKFFISILWRASISQLEEWSNINLGGYEKKALDILKVKREYPELFKILIYKNSLTEDINQEVLIAKGKTSKYKNMLFKWLAIVLRLWLIQQGLQININYNMKHTF